MARGELLHYVMPYLILYFSFTEAAPGLPGARRDEILHYVCSLIFTCHCKLGKNFAVEICMVLIYIRNISRV